MQAFTVVSARPDFSHASTPVVRLPQPPLVPPPPTDNELPKPQKTARDWPQAVRQYVQRSFAEQNTIPGIDKKDMEVKLKQIISEAAESNTLLSTDWNSLPLPQTLIQAERNSLFKMPVASATAQAPIHNSVFDTNDSSHGTPSRKRKSSDLADEPPSSHSIPPWRSRDLPGNLQSRLSFADKRPRTDASQPSDAKITASLENRKRRFETEARRHGAPPPWRTQQEPSPVVDEDIGPIVGRCQNLEKKYFRLTSAPNPDHVRPPAVLKQTLDLLKQKWKDEHNYLYICDQFKSLRQDLTVQHIRTELTVNAYEIHARIALEKGDLGEYNQCQTQLRTLYAMNLGGHPPEFNAYRILYVMHTCNRIEMNDILADLTPTEQGMPAVKHALESRSSLALGDYHRFFNLYKEAPNMGAYLMDTFIARERLAALAAITKAYHQVPLRFVVDELAFESDQEAARFIVDNGGAAFLEEREGQIIFLGRTSAAVFEVARKAAFQRVDIKGQI